MLRHVLQGKNYLFAQSAILLFHALSLPACLLPFLPPHLLSLTLWNIESVRKVRPQWTRVDISDNKTNSNSSNSNGVSKFEYLIGIYPVPVIYMYCPLCLPVCDDKWVSCFESGGSEHIWIIIAQPTTHKQIWPELLVAVFVSSSMRCPTKLRARHQQKLKYCLLSRREGNYYYDTYQPLPIRMIKAVS